MAITRPVPSVRRFATMLPLAFAGSCSRANVGHFQELGTFHAPNMHTLYPGVTHFVTAPESTMREPAAVLAFSRRTCADEDEVCFVLYWTDASKAASGFPISAREAQGMVASYIRNRSTGAEGFQCYNFGSPGRRCLFHR